MSRLTRNCPKCGAEYWKMELVGEGPAKFSFDYYKVYFCWECGALVSFNVRLPNEEDIKKAEKKAEEKKVC